MGLDSVEFVMAVEEAFQIAIPDDVAERILTPGELVQYLLSRVGDGGNTPGCLEQRAFYRLRTGVMQVFAVPRKAIVPASLWEELLPPRRTRHNWQLLHQAVGTPYWPRLSLWGKVPREIASVGRTARHLAAQTPAVFMWADESWTQVTVEGLVRRLMRDRLGITEFEWNQQFIRDLGVD